MELETKVMEMLKEAMKAKDEASLRALRAIKGAIIVAKTEKNAGELDAEKELALLQKLAKQRRESIEVFVKQAAHELAAKEQEELTVIEKFLPKQLSEAEIKPVIEKIIQDLGITNIKEMGKAIAEAAKQLKGQAEGSTISRLIKEHLSN